MNKSINDLLINVIKRKKSVIENKSEIKLKKNVPNIIHEKDDQYQVY